MKTGKKETHMKGIAGNLLAQGLKMGVVVSRFNDLFTGQLLEGVKDCLLRHGADEKDVTVAWVPGANESPLVAQWMAASGKHDAVIVIGVVIQGATTHAELINGQVSRSLAKVAMDHNVPVINGIVAASNMEQAIERCGTKAGNKGWSAAQAAIEMATLRRAFKV